MFIVVGARDEFCRRNTEGGKVFAETFRIAYAAGGNYILLFLWGERGACSIFDAGDGERYVGRFVCLECIVVFAGGDCAALQYECGGVVILLQTAAFAGG